MEQVLRNQLIGTILPEYVDALCNINTAMTNYFIPDIIAFLYFFGMTDQEFSVKDNDVNSTAFNSQQLVDIIFNKIKLFQDLCILTNTDKTDYQLI